MGIALAARGRDSAPLNQRLMFVKRCAAAVPEAGSVSPHRYPLMSFRTLLAVHRHDRPVRHLHAAAAIAHRHGAHLNVLVAAVMPPFSPMDFVRDDPSSRSRPFAQLIDDAERCTVQARSLLADQDVAHTVMTVCEPLPGLDGAIGRHALTCDLVLLPSPRTLLDGIGAHALQGSLVRAGKPVLAMQDEAAAPLTGTRTALIAWHAARESSHAVQQALPLLSEASSVRLLQVGNLDDADLDGQRDAVAVWLMRHGIELSSERLTPGGATVAGALAERLQDPELDLVVMGAYGHSPLVESWFAGATHAALRDSTTNLFLTH